VWFPNDPKQPPWQRFLDEVRDAGYKWVELGPYGYLPTDPNQLSDELESRGLRLSGGAMFTSFHRPSQDSWDTAWAEAQQVGKLLAALGAEHLISLPEMWGEAELKDTSLRTPGQEQWENLAELHNRFGRALKEEFGLRQQFHSHAESQIGTYREVERLLQVTDPEYVNLCLDTGHFAYYGGDSVRLIKEYPDRIGYLHLKQVDQDLLFDVLKNGRTFADAVPEGIMTEPPNGFPEFGPILDAASDLGRDIFAVVEQDMYPLPNLETPFPIAERTRKHILSCSHYARIR
jgi:inosose dehydratase